MNVKKILGLICMVTLLLPVLTNAEIYKWKDKNGVMRYSDTPPPSNIKVDTLRGRSANNANAKGAPEDNAEATASKKTITKTDEKSEDEAARMRARNAESEKRNKEEEKKMAKLNAENCKAAKANLEQFAQGGRIYKTNDKGEREYYSDNDLTAGKRKARVEINKYCK